MLKQQEALFKSLSYNQPTDSTSIFTQNTVWNALETFSYASDEDKTFEAYYRRYEDIYITDCADWTDAKKCPATSTKARNCGTQVRRLFLTKKTCELGFLETAKLLSGLFSSKMSLFHKKWKCLNLTKRDSDDYLGFASIVNKNCDDFKLGKLSADNFKYLIFTQGLVLAKDAEIRCRILSKLENKPNLTLQKLAEDRQRIVSVRKDSKNIKESGVAYVRKVKHRSQSYSPVKQRKNMITQNFNTDRLVTTKKNHPALATTVEKYIGPRTVSIVQKNVKTAINLDIRAHRKIIKNRVRHTKSEDKSDKVVHKYITVKVLNKSVRFQLDSGSDLSIINLQTWRKLNWPIIKMTSKTARTVTEDKIKFEGKIIIPVSLNGITKKSKVFILKNSENLFGSDWFQSLISWINQLSRFAKK